jgi:hypothetical protein
MRGATFPEHGTRGKRQFRADSRFRPIARVATAFPLFFAIVDTDD